MEKKLFIIDGNSILYREYFAMPGLTNRYGDYTGALFGFSKIITEILTRFRPSHIAVAFDAGKITFRNAIYDGYKATRKPMPEDLRSQVEPVKNMLKLMKIKVVEQAGVEGDDIIGSLAKKFDIDKVIITGDRDSYQLVDKNTVVYLNKKGLSNIKILDEEAVFAEFGLKPSQMVYVKALQGDMSDNIPGVRGVGEKTALSLISKYGDLDGVYANIDEIKGSLRQKLEDDKDSAYMSLELARIKCDVDLDFELDDLQVKFPYSSEVKGVFLHNEFRSLLKRDDIYEKMEEAASRVDSVCKENIELMSVKEIESVIEVGKEVGFFFGEDKFHFSYGPKEYFVRYDNVSEEELLRAMTPVVSDAKSSVVVFDSKSERHRFWKVGVEIAAQVFDCMIAKHLILGVGLTKIQELIDYPEDMNFIASYMLYSKGEYLENLERMGMAKLYADVELPLSVLLFEMEREGFRIDEQRLRELDAKYDKELKFLAEAIYASAGREFNLNSPKQMAEVIYDELAISKSKKRSTASEVLEKFADRHEIIPLVIRFRKVAKYSSGFIKNMFSHMDKNGFVHTNLNQTLTTTGRLSSSEPNLQNIPIRGEESRELRSVFVASAPDRILVDVDYSQIELRILAHVTGDDGLIDAFNNNIDIHSQTAMEIFGVPQTLVTQDMRRQAKVINFGIIYGMSDFGLAEDLNISVLEAKSYIERFFKAHPKLVEFMHESVRTAKETGRATTILGRTRKMLEINSSNYQIRQRAERATYNMPIQGSAADIIKVAMLNTKKSLIEAGVDAKLIMQVHDELIVDCAASQKERVLALVQNAMSGAIKLKVELLTDGSMGYRWSEGH